SSTHGFDLLRRRPEPGSRTGATPRMERTNATNQPHSGPAAAAAPHPAAAKNVASAPGAAEQHSAAAYRELRRAVIAARLLERTYGYYLTRTLATYTMLGVALAIPFGLPATMGWTALAVGLMGMALVQI